MDELNYIFIYYMNDCKHSVTVQVNHSFMFDPNNPAKQPNIEYFSLGPAEARVFKVEVPENSIPYVKNWGNRVLLSFLEAGALEQIQSQLPKS